MQMKNYELVCGVAFEDLSFDEMMDYDGGGSFATVTPATTLPCAVGASITLASVGITALIFG